MSLGTITQFPITTILEYATSGEHGLCPQLCGSVSPFLSECDVNAPVSERGIRQTLDNVNTTVLYQNLGNGFPIYSNSNGITALYNTLSATSQYITGFINNDTLILSGYGDSGSTITSSTTATSPISIQGGKFQYSDTIAATAIPTSGYVIANASKDDLIAKTFIKCTVPFEQNSSLYSIGLSAEDFEDYQLITNQFMAPSAQGLVPFSYSTSMSSEYYWLTGDTEIRIYRYGSQPSYGELGVSVFYDNVVWSPSYGYVMGFAGTNDIVRYNLEFDYLDVSYRANRISDAVDQYSATSYNSYIYTAGGQDDTYVYNDINRYETKNDTVNAIDRGGLVTTRRAFTSEKSTTNLYFVGGTDKATEGSYTIIDNIQFANDTATAVSNANLSTGRSSNGTVANASSLWTAGGYYGGSSLTDTIRRLDFTSDTTTASVASTLNTACLKMGGEWNTTTDGYFLPGHTSTLDVNVLDKITFSSETVTSTTDFAILVRSMTSAVQSSINGYRLGGTNVETSAYPISSIEKYDFGTATMSITNVLYDGNQDGGTRGASV